MGSVSREEMESKTREMVRAGLHCSLRISRQMLPFLLICGDEKRSDEEGNAHVWMVDLGVELNLGGLEGIVRGEVDVQEEDATGIGAVLLAADEKCGRGREKANGAHDGGSPVEQVVVHGAGTARSSWMGEEGEERNSPGVDDIKKQ